MKKGPKVYNYLEYAIVSFIFNILFGTVAIVLAGKVREGLVDHSWLLSNHKKTYFINLML